MPRPRRACTPTPRRRLPPHARTQIIIIATILLCIICVCVCVRLRRSHAAKVEDEDAGAREFAAEHFADGHDGAPAAEPEAAQPGQTGLEAGAAPTPVHLAQRGRSIGPGQMAKRHQPLTEAETKYCSSGGGSGAQPAAEPPLPPRSAPPMLDASTSVSEQLGTLPPLHRPPPQPPLRFGTPGPTSPPEAARVTISKPRSPRAAREQSAPRTAACRYSEMPARRAMAMAQETAQKHRAPPSARAPPPRLLLEPLPHAPAAPLTPPGPELVTFRLGEVPPTAQRYHEPAPSAHPFATAAGELETAPCVFHVADAPTTAARPGGSPSAPPALSAAGRLRPATTASLGIAPELVPPPTFGGASVSPPPTAPTGGSSLRTPGTPPPRQPFFDAASSVAPSPDGARGSLAAPTAARGGALPSTAPPSPGARVASSDGDGASPARRHFVGGQDGVPARFSVRE